jgi:hypothetical protein
MRPLYFFLLPLASFLFSCSGTEEAAKDDAPRDSSNVIAPRYATDNNGDFEKRFSIMLNSLAQKDKAILSKYVSPEFGLMIIRSEGALPYIMMSHQSKEEYQNSLEEIFINAGTACELKNEPLPHIVCDGKNTYSKEGCFVRDTNRLANSDIWKVGDLSEEDEKFAEDVISSIGRTVVMTNGYVYYFAYQNNSWYLVLIDMRKPCNA